MHESNIERSCKLMRFTIDRIEEGIVIAETGEGVRLSLPLALFGGRDGEGGEAAEGRTFDLVRNFEAEEQRRRHIEELLAELMSEDRDF